MSEPIHAVQLKNGEILQIFSATEADLPEIEELSEPFGFETGLETLRIYYRTSHEEWWIVRNSKGEMVAYENANLMPNGWIKGMNVVVRKDYQNLSVARHLPRIRDSPPWLGNLTSAALLRGSVNFHGPAQLFYKLLYYFGQIKQIKEIKNPGNVEISKLNAADFGTLMEYDQKIVLVNREKFINMWCSEETAEVQTFIAKSAGHVVGYGVIRKLTETYYGLGPLYSENSETAELLFWNLLRNFVAKTVSILILATNSTALKLVHQAGLELLSAEIRYGCPRTLEYQNSLPMQKCFACLDYWPL